MSAETIVFLKKMTFACAGLQGVLIILWFFPVITIVAGFGAVSSSESMSSANGGFNVIMVLLGIISIITLIIPVLSDTLQKHRHYIMAKISASIYLGIYVLILVSTTEEAKKYYSAGITITFWGYLYIAACIAIIVITFIMSSKTKVKK